MRDRAAERAAAVSMQRALPLLNSNSVTYQDELQRYQAAVMAATRRERRRRMWISGCLTLAFFLLSIVTAVFGGGWLFLAPAVFALVPGAAWVIERRHPPDPYGHHDPGTVSIEFPRK